jgi:hypothetical protein
MSSAAAHRRDSDDLTLGDIEEQEMWEEHTRERVKQMDAERAAAKRDCPTCHGVSTVDPDPDCPTCHGEGEVAARASELQAIIGQARFEAEGCECDRRGLTEHDECIHNDPCPSHRIPIQARLELRRLIAYGREMRDVVPVHPWELEALLNAYEHGGFRTNG